MSVLRRNPARRLPCRFHDSWHCDTLERRLLLAADIAAAVSIQTDTVAEAIVEPAASPPAIVFIDSEVENLAALTAELSPDAEWHLIPEQSDAIDYISRILELRSDLQSVHLISHGKSGIVKLGGQEIDATVFRQRADEISRWSKSLAPTADILIYGCEVAADAAGQALLHTIADVTKRDVAASDDRTGHNRFAADWTLEKSVGTIEASLAFSTAVMDRFDSYLAITIRAAGTTGEEQMQLQIDGATVATFNNIGGNADAGDFQTYTYNTSQDISADRVRVVFTNDVYVPGGIDRNLRVDSIAINSVTFQTEDPSVFSTGTWLPADGVTPGFRQSEYLHANGYFQYASPTTAQGSLIEILAAGETGNESLELRINDQVVQSWNNVGGNVTAPSYQSFLFRAAETVTPDQVKVAFTNDLFAGGVDRNLRVDKVIIDGVTYEIEAPTVYSTGTYLEADGIQAGFRQSEFLHANGFFQLQLPSSSAGVIALQASSYSVSEISGAALVSVVRTQGSSGTVTVDYSTFAATATANADYTTKTGTLTFAPGETIKTVSIPIINDSVGESNETFSFAIDNVTGGATLLVPRTAVVTIVDDDTALANYPTFGSSTNIKLNGPASIANGKLKVNNGALNKNGTAYFKTSVAVSDATSFQSNFQFDLNGVNSLASDAGLLFVVQNSTAGVGAFNQTAGSWGYQGVDKSIALQFDSRLLTSGNNQNFVSLLVNGNLTPVQTAQTPLVQYAPNSTANVWVEYNGANNQLNVFISTTTTKPTTATLTATVDLAALLGNKAFFGFAAGTGSVKTIHSVNSWTVSLEQPGSGGGGGGATGIVAETVIEGFNRPTAIEWTPDGRNLYVAQKGGLVFVVRDGVRLSNRVVDMLDTVNAFGDRGLLDIAVHPDFANNPYLYLLYTYDPPQVNQNVGNPNAGPDGAGNRAGRLTRVTLDAATNYTTVVPNSEVILLGQNSTWANFNGFVNSTIDDSAPPAGILPDGSNLQDFIASDSTSHSIGSLAFGPDGALYVSIGDGSSFNRVDARATRVQDIDNLSGKILRINPITGAGLADNPFYNGNANANQSKVYQYGFRNPFRFSIDPRNGKVYVGDVGWTNWEEINSGAPGANFGWPFYEGSNTGNAQTIGYNVTPAAQAFYASGIQVTAPQIALNHSADRINAIVGGDVYTGSAYPSQYFGDVFFNDLGQGIVRHASLDANGNVTDVQVFATGAQVVVQIVQGPDGRLYYVDLDDGLIGRWNFV